MCYKLREVVQQTLSLAYSVDTAAVAKVPLLDYLDYRENTSLLDSTGSCSACDPSFYEGSLKQETETDAAKRVTKEYKLNGNVSMNCIFLVPQPRRTTLRCGRLLCITTSGAVQRVPPP